MTAVVPPESARRRHDKLLQLRQLRGRQLEQVARQQSRFQTDPVGWVETRLGEHMWSKQREIATALVEHRKVAVQSCHDAGKSWLAARLCCWFIDTHAPGEAFVVTSAPTYAQVRAILWREIGKAHRKGGLAGRVTQTEWKFGNELVAFGRKPADTDETGFQGIHARWVMVVFDEACGIPKQLWTAGDAIATNEDARMLAIGNPDDPTSEFAEVCKPASGWHTIRIDGLETPNVTGEPVPDDLRPLLVSPVWIEEKRRTWGEDSPLWVAKVRGEFPEDAVDTNVVPLSFIRRCQLERDYKTDPDLPDFIDSQLAPVELGVDVGGGGDESVIRERRGIKAGRVWRDQSADPMRVVGKTMQAISLTGATRVKVDVIGVGYGVAGRLEELGREGKHRADVLRVNVAEEPDDKGRFSQLRDELWWSFREMCESGSLDLRDLDDDTVAQLIAVRYGIDSLGRVKIEPKDETRKRIQRSPDDADALLLSFWRPGRRRSRKLVSW